MYPYTWAAARWPGWERSDACVDGIGNLILALGHSASLVQLLLFRLIDSGSCEGPFPYLRYLQCRAWAGVCIAAKVGLNSNCRAVGYFISALWFCLSCPLFILPTPIVITWFETLAGSAYVPWKSSIDCFISPCPCDTDRVSALWMLVDVWTSVFVPCQFVILWPMLAIGGPQHNATTHAQCIEGERNTLNAFSIDSRLSRWTSSQPQTAA